MSDSFRTGHDHNDLSKLSFMLTWNMCFMMYCLVKINFMFWLTYVPSNLFFPTVVSRDRPQAGRNHAHHHGWELGSAVQRHPERSPHRQGGLQPSGGPIHQRWAVRWHCPTDTAAHRPLFQCLRWLNTKAKSPYKHPQSWVTVPSSGSATPPLNKSASNTASKLHLTLRKLYYTKLYCNESVDWPHSIWCIQNLLVMW